MLEQPVHHTIDTKQVRFSDKARKYSIYSQHTGPTQLTRTFARAHISTNDFWLVILATIVSIFELKFSMPI